MLILIEGCDRTGKSTLARKLVEPHGKYLHFDKPQHHPLNEYGRPVVGHDPVNDVLVMDRGFVGELVWPTIFGRESELDLPGRRWLELLYLSRGGRIIHANRDLLEILDACKRDGEPVQGEQVGRVCGLFWERLEESLLHVCRYDQEHLPIHPRVKDAWREWNEICAKPLAVHHRWIGNPMPRVLLVGERIGPAAVNGLDPLVSRAWDLPFVPYTSTSGHFMLGDLPTPWLTSIALVNSMKPDGEPEDLPRLWEAMQYPVVVTLGKTADEVVSRQGVPHGTAPHPQYVRRFKRSEGPGYMTNLILEAAGDVT